MREIGKDIRITELGQRMREAWARGDEGCAGEDVNERRGLGLGKSRDGCVQAMKTAFGGNAHLVLLGLEVLQQLRIHHTARGGGEG
jgi:hypothetical protein